MAEILQFAARNGQVGAPTPTESADLPQVKRGDKGSLVVALQEALNDLGFRDCGGNLLIADGDFGPKTECAVKAFQRSAGLLGLGIVEHTTWAALQRRGKAFYWDHASSVVTQVSFDEPVTITAEPRASEPQENSASPFGWKSLSPSLRLGIIAGGVIATGLFFYWAFIKKEPGYRKLLSGPVNPPTDYRCPRVPPAEAVVDGELVKPVEVTEGVPG